MMHRIHVAPKRQDVRETQVMAQPPPDTVRLTKEQVAKIRWVDMKYIPKTITIRGDQAKFLKDNSISLSRFVQAKLDELMGKGTLDLGRRKH